MCRVITLMGHSYSGSQAGGAGENKDEEDGRIFSSVLCTEIPSVLCFTTSGL